MYALKSQISVHKSIFREVFCHIYDKIPRHTGQNAITVGDLKCILAKCCEGSEQQLNQAAREFDSCIIKIVRAGRIKPVLFLSSFSLYYLVIFSDM